MTTVDTRKSAFRPLRLATLDDLIAEVDRLVAADHAGTLRQTGNWTLGQALGHVAGWIDFGFEGYPPEMRPPWIVKLIVRIQRRRFLDRPMQRGFRIPGTSQGTWCTEVLTTDDGAGRLRRAVGRLRAGAPPHPSPIFGPFTQDECIRGTLRHAELHLGYFTTG